jgi:GxxExxY protein
MVIDHQEHQGHQEQPVERRPIDARTDQIARDVVDAAFRVHKTLGPGLLESVYEACLLHELTSRGLVTQRQVALPIVYNGLRLPTGLRLDLLVNDTVIVEIKAVDKLIPLNDAQVLTYLRLSQKRLALLINFNVLRIKDGIRRFAP